MLIGRRYCPYNFLKNIVYSDLSSTSSFLSCSCEYLRGMDIKERSTLTKDRSFSGVAIQVGSVAEENKARFKSSYAIHY